MHPHLVRDLDRLPALLESTRSYAEEVLTGLAERPTSPQLSASSADTLPQVGIGLEGALERFGNRWESRFSGSAGPRYLGFVTGGTTPASLAGDWLTTAFDQNAASDRGASELERETVGWLAELFELDQRYSGSFVTGATMSNFVGLAVGREWLGEQQGVSVADAGVQALGDVAILSGAPHSSISKALSMLGIGRGQLRQVPVQPGREAVDIAQLREALEVLGGRPAIVVANAGTVNTVDFDDLNAIAALKREHPFWLHVDAAFGAFAALSPEHSHLIDGLEKADSICVDLHKWLNVPYDAAIQFTHRRDLQLNVFKNAAPYLGTPTDNPDFLHLTPENSRRLRALSAWFSLTAYGVEGHREIVERNISSARRLGDRLQTLPGVRLAAPVRLNVTCFAVPGDTAAVARAIAASGEAFVTPSVYDGEPVLRAAFSNWRTTDLEDERVFAAIAGALASMPPT